MHIHDFNQVGMHGYIMCSNLVYSLKVIAVLVAAALKVTRTCLSSKNLNLKPQGIMEFITDPKVLSIAPLLGVVK